MSNTPTYYSYSSMLKRCYKPTCASFKRYGGRGIKVCDRWLESFENFLEDMGTRNEGTTLDRIDVDKDYSPENCRWATRKEQDLNKTNSVYITAFNETKPATYWVKEYEISLSALYSRIKRGWDPEQALSYPSKRKHKSPTREIKPQTYQGVTKNWDEWADEYDIPRGVFRKRILEYNWTIEKTLETPVRKVQREGNQKK